MQAQKIKQCLKVDTKWITVKNTNIIIHDDIETVADDTIVFHM